MRTTQSNEKLVKRKFHNAHIASDFEGNVYVEIPSTDEEADPFIPAIEFFMPVTNNIEQAWKYALMCLRIQQNFNRTHPERIIDEDFNERLERIQERNSKKENNV